MYFQDVLKKEWNVVVHAQSKRFRLIKYAVLILLFAALYTFFGMNTVVKVFESIFILGVVVHFIFRWKTKAWTIAWGPFDPRVLDTVEKR